MTRLPRILGPALAWLTLGAASSPHFPTEAAIRARYTIPQSQFAELDHEPVHFVIEGKGPAILLLHGSFASLRQWDGWARALKRRFTVVRYDASPMGLSGPHPTADYSMAHRIRVIDALMDRAGAQRFVIVGTSSAGVTTAAYAAIRPQRIKAVVLNNIAVGPVNFDLATLPEALKNALAEDAKHPGWHEPDYWRQILLHNVVDKSVVSPALVNEWTALNNRVLQVPGAAKAVAGSTPTSRTPDDLRQITAPTLLLWSRDDVETRLDREGQQALALTASNDKALVVVDRCGHMMPLDCSHRALSAALPFLERTARLP